MLKECVCLWTCFLPKGHPELQGGNPQKSPKICPMPLAAGGAELLGPGWHSAPQILVLGIPSVQL